jgi:sulfate permease, SulP family
VLTGVVMLAVGLLRLGSVLRFVSNAVMVGFLSAVGVSIVLGQLANFTGYQAQGSNRVVRAFDTLLHPAQLHLQTLTIGVTTIALILLLERTRLGALALVVAVIVASAATAAFGWVVPALSLAFIGLVQGAGILANFPNPDGSYPDASRDFVGQGAANVAAAVVILQPYAQGLAALGSKLVIVSANKRIQEQLAVTGITDVIGSENLYIGDERVGATLKRAHADAMAWTRPTDASAGATPMEPARDHEPSNRRAVLRVLPAIERWRLSALYR